MRGKCKRGPFKLIDIYTVEAIRLSYLKYLKLNQFVLTLFSNKIVHTQVTEIHISSMENVFRITLIVP